MVGGLGSCDTFTFVPDSNGGTEIYDPPNAPYSGSISTGGPGNDNFVFHAGSGAESDANINVQADTTEPDHFAHAELAQHLASFVTADAQGDAVIEHSHSDSITIPGVTANYLHAHLQSLVHLH